jgi:hypothetical protein
MKKFSAGGAQGRYDRRMADIEKDFKKNSAGKSGKALEVLEAKRMQRTADAKDDLAKRTGADRTATRAAESAAERNLTMTRKYGAPQAVSKLAPVASEKITETLSLPKMDRSIGAKPKASKPVQKPVQKAVDTAPKRTGDQGFAYKKKDMASIRENAPTHRRYVRGGSNSGAAADGTAAKRLEAKGLKTGDTKGTGTGTSRLARAADPKDTSSAASRARFGAAMSYLNPFSYIENRARRQDPSEVNKAKGGKVKKEKTMKYAKGGKMAPKFGAAMKKKSADTKGRAMMKKAGGGKCYAKGGSIDGIAKKGKTKGKMLAMGGMAGYKRGGKTC